VLGSTLLGLAHASAAVQITTNPISLVDTVFPKTVQGSNGVFLQARPGGTSYNSGSSGYVDLTHLSDTHWGTVGAPWNLPSVLKTDATTIHAHPSAVSQVGHDYDPVIRLDLGGDLGELRLTGSAATASWGDVTYYIYLGADGWQSPLWVSNGGGSFDLTLRFAAGDSLYLATDARGADHNDWAEWHSVSLVGTGDPIGRAPEPTTLGLLLAGLGLLGWSTPRQHK
jgi:hypothetical protein